VTTGTTQSGFQGQGGVFVGVGLPPGTGNQKQSQPVLAKDNFLLAHKGIVPGVSRLVQQKEKQELMMGKTKEVDEWVEAAEAGAHSKKVSSTINTTGPLNNHGLSSAPGGDDDHELKEDVRSDKDEVEDESWMFKTFSKVNMSSKNKASAPNSNDSSCIEQPYASKHDFSDQFLTAGLSDLLQFDLQQAPQYP
jgi:hypothetical protein